jgi:uncharacterized protein YbaR (Trm112 family)
VHIVLTDVLTCPRCGPAHGLILLADRLDNRRVIEGALGCANCRERYLVREGVVRFDGAGPAAASPAGEAGAGRATAGAASAASAVPEADTAAHAGEDALRLAALLGVTHGPGFLLVAGPAVVHAAALAQMIEGIEVIALAAVPQPAGAGVNVLAQADTADRLPLATGKMRAVALTGAAAELLLVEGARVASPVGRLLLQPVPADMADRLPRLGLRVLAHEGDTMIAVRA